MIDFSKFLAPGKKKTSLVICLVVDIEKIIGISLNHPTVVHTIRLFQLYFSKNFHLHVV